MSDLRNGTDWTKRDSKSSMILSRSIDEISWHDVAHLMKEIPGSRLYLSS